MAEITGQRVVKNIMTYKNVIYNFVLEEIISPDEEYIQLNGYIQRTNTSSSLIESDYIKCSIEVNGEAVIDAVKRTCSQLEAGETYAGARYNCGEYSLTNGSSLAFDFNVRIHVDYYDGALLSYWKENGGVSFSFTSSSIDISTPKIQSANSSADRYGRRAIFTFEVFHSTYKIENINFYLRNLTRNQWINSTKITTPEARVTGGNDVSTGHYIRVLFTETESQQISVEIQTDERYPFESGNRYQYEIEAKALNGKTALITNFLTIPQKVEGITCESYIDILLGQTKPIEYSVLPSTAEEQGVIFSTDNSAVAAVDSNGNITAKSVGSCYITIETVDGGSFDATRGFITRCQVNVLASLSFPELNPVTNFLTANIYQKIRYAADFVKSELNRAGATVEEFENSEISGQAHSIFTIKSALTAMELNCHKLKVAAEKQGFSSDVLPSNPRVIDKKNSDWLSIVNLWIVFLNDIHSKINGGE